MMTIAEPERPRPKRAVDRELHCDLSTLLAFRAPYLEEKLVHLDVVETESEARSLFQEIKKYLVLAETRADHELPMFSVRVDETWHQFALFTAQYTDFCQRFFGRYLHHVPDEAPKSEATSAARKTTFEEFRAAYEALFGALSPDWFDENALRATTRLVRSPFVQKLAVQREGDCALLVHAAAKPQLICKVQRRAEPALRFLVEHSVLFVRELPGLSLPDAIELCRPLVRFHVLRLLP